MVSLDAYFRAEEKSLTKNEYHNGIILPMAGGKLKHNRLAQKAASLMDAFIDNENLDRKECAEVVPSIDFTPCFGR